MTLLSKVRLPICMGFRRLLSVVSCVCCGWSVVRGQLWVVIELGSDISHRLFVGWVESHRDWVSPLADQPTCQPFLCYQRNPTKWPKIEPSRCYLLFVTVHRFGAPPFGIRPHKQSSTFRVKAQES